MATRPRHSRPAAPNGLRFEGSFTVISRDSPRFIVQGRHLFHSRILWHNVGIESKDVILIASHFDSLAPGFSFKAVGTMAGINTTGVPMIRIRTRSIFLIPGSFPTPPDLAGTMKVTGTGTVVGLAIQRLGTINNVHQNVVVTLAHSHHTPYEVSYYCSIQSFMRQFRDCSHFGWRVTLRGTVDGYQQIPGRWLVQLDADEI